MDPLSRLLIHLKPQSYNCGGLNLGAASTIHFSKHEGLKCYAVVSGEAWLWVEGLTGGVQLHAGDCFLLPRGRSFRISGTQDHALASSTSVARVECGTIATYSGGGQCLLVGAHYAFTGTQAVMLLNLLPALVHLRNSADNLALCWTLQAMTEELNEPKPGGVVIAHSLARIMLVQALRTWIRDCGRHDLGGISAFFDAQMSRAITAMQEEPALDWTVKRLANRAGMSRASFALKFKAMVHQSPVQYLTRWRMLLAEDRIATTSEPISAIALSLGYDSASAFAKAYKKVTGESPRRHRIQTGQLV